MTLIVNSEVNSDTSVVKEDDVYLAQHSEFLILARRLIRPLTASVLDEPETAQDALLEEAVVRCYEALAASSVCVELDADKDRSLIEALKAAPWLCSFGLLNVDVPLYLEDDTLYLTKYARQEARVAKSLLRRTEVEHSDFSPEKIAESLVSVMRVGDNMLLAPQQVRAIASAVVHPVSVITGGPGTGKTTTVARMLATLQELHDEPLTIRLAAPTGKASDRLAESIAQETKKLGEVVSESVIESLNDVESFTLHKLLGARRTELESFRFGSNLKLDGDVFVIDEVSMVSLPLMYRLLEALPEGAKLILVGDADQLASVETGTVLSDIIEGLEASAKGIKVDKKTKELDALLCKTWKATAVDSGIDEKTSDAWPKDGLDLWCSGLVRLNRAHRFESNVGDLVSAIQLCATDLDTGTAQIRSILETEHDANSLLPRHAVAVDEKPKNDSGTQAFFDRYLDHLEDLEHKVAEVAQCVGKNGKLEGDAEDLMYTVFSEDGLANKMRLLCTNRSGKLGSVAWNRRISEELAQRNASVPCAPDGARSGGLVMVTENAYDLGLFNGDTGIVVQLGGRWRVVFLGKEGALVSVAYSRVYTRIEPAYAITIHKSQGSQFAHVGVQLGEKDNALNSRELLYTGVSRAKEQVEVFGEMDAIVQAAGTKIRRASGLATRLASA